MMVVIFGPSTDIRNVSTDGLTIILIRSLSAKIAASSTMAKCVYPSGKVGFIFILQSFRSLGPILFYIFIDCRLTLNFTKIIFGL